MEREQTTDTQQVIAAAAAPACLLPRHDGHIMPPGPEDWARYHAAEARLQASRPLSPRPHWGGHKRHKR